MSLPFDKTIIFTDLDGTLLDHYNYSFKPAQSALNFLKKNNVPVIFTSSKTRPEVVSLQIEAGIKYPYCTENGGALILPAGTFDKEEKIIHLGASYHEIRSFLSTMQLKGFKFEGFGDMIIKKISQITGLDEISAKKAAQRNASEPLLWLGDEEQKRHFIKLAENHGLQAMQGGRFLSVGGQTDKGKAALKLIELYQQNGFDIQNIVALGDSENDKALLSIATHPIWIKKSGPTPQTPFLNKARCTISYGPQGWAESIFQIFL